MLKSPEFLKIDTPTLVHIEHPNHHLDRMGIETRKITIDKCFPQLPLCQMPCPTLVHSFEEWKE